MTINRPNTVDIRASYLAFPDWSQPIWTLITGKAADDEEPLWIIGRLSYLIMSCVIFFSGICLSIYGFGLPLPIAIPVVAVAATLTLLGSRLLVLTVAHQCAHNNVADSNFRNEVIHDLITTITCSQEYHGYRQDHFYKHHGLRFFGTLNDPVLDYIIGLGFAPGMSKAALRRQLLLTVISPTFHGGYLKRRIISNFLSGTLRRRAMAYFWWATIGSAVIVWPFLLAPMLIGYILPLTICYHVSAFLELLCEHRWVRSMEQSSLKQRIVALSWGRFCGDPVPERGNIVEWLIWIARLLFYHIPCRIFVLNGDAPSHDYHHIAPHDKMWPISAYRRKHYAETGRLGTEEIWGLAAAIDSVFDQLAQAETVGTGYEYLNQPAATASQTMKIV